VRGPSAGSSRARNISVSAGSQVDSGSLEDESPLDLDERSARANTDNDSEDTHGSKHKTPCRLEPFCAFSSSLSGRSDPLRTTPDIKPRLNQTEGPRPANRHWDPPTMRRSERVIDGSRLDRAFDPV